MMPKTRLAIAKEVHQLFAPEEESDFGPRVRFSNDAPPHSVTNIDYGSRAVAVFDQDYHPDVSRDFDRRYDDWDRRPGLTEIFR